MDNDPNLSQQDIEQITRYLDVGTKLAQADLAFLFGGSPADPAYIATELFRQGTVKYIVVTGGTNRKTGINEAHTHQALLLQASIPPERIIVEDQSTNTLENVVCAIPILQTALDVHHVKSIVVITKWYHCRRATMTLKRHLPLGIRYYIRPYVPEGVPQTDWHLHEASRKRALKEWERIPFYLQAGHLAEIRREAEAFV